MIRRRPKEESKKMEIRWLVKRRLRLEGCLAWQEVGGRCVGRNEKEEK